MPPRTVLHGVGQSAENYDDLPANGNMASTCYIEDTGGMRIYDSTDRAWKPFDYIPFEYDFDDDGGVVGSIGLGTYVPENTIILDGLIDVAEAVVGGAGATIAIRVENDNDILAAAVLATNGTVGFHDVVPVGSAATAIKVTGNKEIKLVVGTNALTAGKLYGYLRCLRGHEGWQEGSSSSQSSSSSSQSSSASSASSSSQSSVSASSASSKSSSSQSSVSASSASSKSSSSSESSSRSRSSSSTS